MSLSCLSFCFGLYIFISLILHVGELVLNTYFVVTLYREESNQTWFTITMGLMLLPMVTVQLVSALLLLQKRGEYLTCIKASATALIHILQLGFVWRHIRILNESEPLWKKRDFADLCLLRLFYAFTASLPILCIQVYMLVSRDNATWILYSATSVTLMAVCWALASFRRQYETNEFENIVLTWPGTLFRLLWRIGEIVTRVLSLAMFANVYYSWVFIVIGLHWLTIVCSIFTSVLGSIEVVGISRCQKLTMAVLISYIYIFCHINFSGQKVQFRYITFYTIMFLENAVVTVVWFITLKDNNDFKVHTMIFINCTAFFISVVSMVIYYRFFHIPASKVAVIGKDSMCVQDGCINCKLSLCAKHSQLLQRPFSAGWVSQYQKALFDGNYYKNLLQDSLIDSMSEGGVSSSSADSSGDGNTEKTKSSTKRSLMFKSSGTYSHRRFIEMDNINQGVTDSDTDGSTVDVQNRQSSGSSTSSSIRDEMSRHFRHQLANNATSRTHLLTESWDNILEADNEGYETDNSMQPLTAFRPISAQSLEDWYSDGYSTDHTSDIYQLPITVLAKNSRCSVSVASDSTECTMCRHMRAFKVRRKYSVASSSQISRHEKIVEEKDDRQCMESDFDTLETPRSLAWYNCSESGDSAFPQDTFSSSNHENTFSGEEEEMGVQESGVELII